MKKKLPVKGIIISGIFSFFLLSVIQKINVINNLNNNIERKSLELVEIKENNKRLTAELDAAESNYNYFEKLARKRLGLIRENEQIVILKDPQQ